MNSLKVFSGNANPALAQEICQELYIDLGKIEIIKFSNENIKVKINENVRGSDVFVIQPSCSPVNEGIIELLIIIDALKHSSADRITAVIPYFPYVRSDKKDEPRISITARLMADLLEASGADRVLTMNLHSNQVQGFFRIPVDQLTAVDLINDYFKKRDLTNHVVVAPDAGSAKRSGVFASLLNLPMAIMDKRRSDDTEQPRIYHVIGEVKGKQVLLFDDEISTGNTILNVTKVLEDFNIKSISSSCVHAVLCNGAAQRIQNSSINELVVTNSVRIDENKKIPKMTILSVAPLLANAIKRIHLGESISELFKSTH